MDDEVVVFFAGHGVLMPKRTILRHRRCHYDASRQRVQNGLAYAEMEGLLDGIPPGES